MLSPALSLLRLGPGGVREQLRCPVVLPGAGGGHARASPRRERHTVCTAVCTARVRRALRFKMPLVHLMRQVRSWAHGPALMWYGPLLSQGRATDPRAVCNRPPLDLHLGRAWLFVPRRPGPPAAAGLLSPSCSLPSAGHSHHAFPLIARARIVCCVGAGAAAARGVRAPAAAAAAWLLKQLKGC